MSSPRNAADVELSAQGTVNEGLNSKFEGMVPSGHFG
jgi:hypothetical protein